MTKTSWAHLPNARHIDAVVDQHHTYADKGTIGRIDNTWSVALAEIHKAGRTAIYQDARQLVWGAMLDPLTALIAWDSAADLLECTPDVLRTMIDLAEPPVCHQAALLLPYAIVRFGT